MKVTKTQVVQCSGRRTSGEVTQMNQPMDRAPRAQAEGVRHRWKPSARACAVRNDGRGAADAPSRRPARLSAGAGAALCFFAAATFCSFWVLWRDGERGKPVQTTSLHVFASAWLTAVSTGLGALPFFFTGHLDHFWVGLSNAFAAGMMVAASLGLILEGASFDGQGAEAMGISLDTAADTYLGVLKLHPFGTAGVVCGGMCGVIFMVGAKRLLSRYEDLRIYDLDGANSRRVLLVIFVMTTHSISEGVAIGVSFGGAAGAQLGAMTTTSLAIHNVPEGLAVSLALVPKGVSPAVAAVWSIVSSLPQPLMALPAFIFVDQFATLLPVGLGFAAGAMLWVACLELLPEALAAIRVSLVAAAFACAGIVMLVMHHVLALGA